MTTQVVRLVKAIGGGGGGRSGRGDGWCRCYGGRIVMDGACVMVVGAPMKG